MAKPKGPAKPLQPPAVEPGPMDDTADTVWIQMRLQGETLDKFRALHGLYRSASHPHTIRLAISDALTLVQSQSLKEGE